MALHMISVSGYKCSMCADQQCYLRVLQLFLLETLIAPFPETVPFTAHIFISLHRPLLSRHVRLVPVRSLRLSRVTTDVLTWHHKSLPRAFHRTLLLRSAIGRRSL
jgi:hypothetical protein